LEFFKLAQRYCTPTRIAVTAYVIVVGAVDEQADIVFGGNPDKIS
jgi:hypothetical protein